MRRESFLEALIVGVGYIFLLRGLNRKDWLPAPAVTHKMFVTAGE